MINFPNMISYAPEGISLAAKVSRVMILYTTASEASTRISLRPKAASTAGCASASLAISSPKSVMVRTSLMPESGSSTTSTVTSIKSTALKAFYCLVGKLCWGSTSICSLRVRRTVSVDRASIGNIPQWATFWTF